MSHLTIEEWTAYVNGLAVGAAPRAHVAACDSCRTEATRWGVVAGGARMATAASAPPLPLADVTAPVRSPLWIRRRAVLASAAAVAVLLGAAYGLVSVLSPTEQPGVTGDGDPVAVAAALTSTDCSDVKVAAGTLESVNGSRLVLRTATGAAVPVSTSDSTEIVRQVELQAVADLEARMAENSGGGEGALSDITDGDAVVVRGRGTEAGDRIAAISVAIMPSSIDPLTGPDRLDLGRMLARNGHASGTVADAGSDGFTVVRSDGTKVRIDTSPSTRVIKQVAATVGELEKGKFTVAVGSATDGGTLAARTVQQNALHGDGELRLPKALPTRQPRDLPRALPRDLFKGLGCNPMRLGTTALDAGR